MSACRHTRPSAYASHCRQCEPTTPDSERWYIIRFYRRGASGVTHVKALSANEAIAKFERGNPGASGIRASIHTNGRPS